MRIVDIRSEYEIVTEEELKSLLLSGDPARNNCYWLSHKDEFPALAVMVNGDRAALHYIAFDGDAGLQGLVEDHLARDSELVRFSVSTHPADDVYIPSEAVLSFATALRAAMEFFLTKQLPTSIQWLQL